MKKLLLALVLVLAMASSTWAAGSSFTVTGDTKIYSSPLGRDNMRIVACTFVADDAVGTIPNLTLNVSTAGVRHGPLLGWFFYGAYIDCNHSGIEPTENSELYVYLNGVLDLLSANGVDQVDNTAECLVTFMTPTVLIAPPVLGDLLVVVTQQAVVTNSATGVIYLLFIAES